MRFFSALCSNKGGGIWFRILLISCTFVMIGGLMFILLRNQQKTQQSAHREALKIAEVGLQKALEQYHADSAHFTEIPKTSYDEGWYMVSVKKDRNTDTLFISFESEGHVGKVSQKKTYVLRLPAASDSSHL
ncbi:MAG: hypothetical protein GF401_11865 [Chitinivibrionales bacterium]|nr:hypothetical protein [Chitinivibrionales bacterium]